LASREGTNGCRERALRGGQRSPVHRGWSEGWRPGSPKEGAHGGTSVHAGPKQGHIFGPISRQDLLHIGCDTLPHSVRRPRSSSTIVTLSALVSWHRRRSREPRLGALPVGPRTRRLMDADHYRNLRRVAGSVRYFGTSRPVAPHVRPPNRHCHLPSCRANGSRMRMRLQAHPLAR